MPISLNISNPELSFSSLSGNVAGPICLESDGKFFPEHDWSDLSVAVATDFLIATRKLLKSPTSTTQKASFFDVPFIVALTLDDPETIRVTLFNNGHVQDWDATDHATRWHQEMMRQARTLAHACRENEWESSSIDTLETLLAD